MGLQCPKDFLPPNTMDPVTTTLHFHQVIQERDVECCSFPVRIPPDDSIAAEGGRNKASHAVCHSKVKLTVDLPSTLEEIAGAQADNDHLQEIQAQISSTQPLPANVITFTEPEEVGYRKVPIARDGFRYQLVVPKKLQTGFLQYYHNNPLGGHFGHLEALLHMLDVAWWSDLQKDIWECTKGCSICQQQKPDNTKPSGLSQSTHFSAVGEMMGINIMGLFP